MRLLRAGRRAFLVELGSLEEAMDLHAALSAGPPPGVTELVPAARTVLVAYDPAATSPDLLAGQLRQRAAAPAPPDAALGPVVEILTTYGGPDLPAVAEHSGLTEEEVVARHTAASYVVAFCGFAPGFAYLVGGDPALRVPRRETPRTRVPAGSVALAGEFTGVYPREAPGGWQLVGRTDVALWDLDRDPPALLPPGTQVRFVPADRPGGST